MKIINKEIEKKLKEFDLNPNLRKINQFRLLHNLIIEIGSFCNKKEIERDLFYNYNDYGMVKFHFQIIYKYRNANI